MNRRILTRVYNPLQMMDILLISSSIRHVSAIVELTCVNTIAKAAIIYILVIKCVEGFLRGCGFTGDRHSVVGGLPCNGRA